MVEKKKKGGWVMMKNHRIIIMTCTSFNPLLIYLEMLYICKFKQMKLSVCYTHWNSIAIEAPSSSLQNYLWQSRHCFSAFYLCVHPWCLAGFISNTEDHVMCVCNFLYNDLHIARICHALADAYHRSRINNFKIWFIIHVNNLISADHKITFVSWMSC